VPFVVVIFFFFLLRPLRLTRLVAAMPRCVIRGKNSF